ncbi:MAG: hypothetical protein WC578_05300 [Candidatus Omnitrophota bacterium]
MKKMVIFLICVLCLGVYFNSLNNGFVFDDKALILNNPFIKSPKLLPQVFKKDIFEHWSGQRPFDLMYRPLQAVSYFLDYKIWGGDKPFGFHLANLLLHLLNGILTFIVLLKLFSDMRLAAIAAVLFIVHPLQVSVVSYLSARADLLSLLFLLSSVLLFLKDLPILSLLSAFLALLSRENAVFLFLFIALVIFIQKQEKSRYRILFSFILLDLVYLAFRFFLFGSSGLAVHEQWISLFWRIVNFAAIIFRYIILLFFPFNLHFLRSAPVITGPLNFKTVIVIFCAALILLILWKLRKNKTIIFGSLWFLFGLLPVFMLMDGYSTSKEVFMAESWFYPASAGIFLILSLALTKLKKNRLLVPAVFVLYFGILTVYNNRIWKDAPTFDKNTFSYKPKYNPLRHILVEDYLEAGFYNEALSEIKEQSKYYSEDDLLINIESGDYYFFTNNPGKALERYNKIVSNHFITLYRMAVCYKMLGNFDKAKMFALASFRKNPYYEPNKDLLCALEVKFKDSCS